MHNPYITDSFTIYKAYCGNEWLCGISLWEIVSTKHDIQRNAQPNMQNTNMKRIKFLLLTGFLCLVVSLSSYGQEASADTLMKHIQNLSSATYSGRMAGTKGYLEAAEYVANTLFRLGIKPFEGDWTQMFEVECNEVENCSLETYVNDNDVRSTYVLGKDFVCAGMTGRGYADAQVVFCGYGIDHPSFNEYANVDPRGKIVMVVTGSPNFLPSTITNSYASLRDKARVAKAHGAVALVAVNMSQTCRYNEVQSHIFSGKGDHLNTFPILQPTRRCGDMLLQNESMDIDSTLSLIAQTQMPQSFSLRKKFEINLNAKYSPKAITCNVMGFLEGSNKKMKDEIIVVGAHLDHVGMQGETCLFPGADNNASGVAAVLETARLLSQAEEAPKRSVLFVFFSAAESQHLGAEIFVSNFSKLSKIDAFVDIECVGNGDSLVVLGNKRFPALWEVANHNDAEHTHYMAHGYKTAPNGDAIPFAQVGIPSIVISNLNGNHFSHVPSDIAENINHTMIQKAATLLFHTVYELCDGDYQGRAPQSRKIKFQ